MTYAEIIYACLDEIKANSDDSYVTEEYVLFLARKWRTALLIKTYKDNKKEVSSSNYQTICLTLEESDAIDGSPCTGGSYLRSVEEIPTTLSVGTAQVYPTDYYQGEITLVSRERMRYVGYNKWLRNIIYCSIGPDNRLYFTSNNPQHMYLESVAFTAVFEDSELADELSCDDGESESCDPMQRTFPLEEGLVTALIELVVKEILGVAYRPQSAGVNDSADDLSDIINWARNNMKSNVQKQIDS